MVAKLEDVVKAIEHLDANAKQIRDVRQGTAPLASLGLGQLKQLQSEMQGEEQDQKAAKKERTEAMQSLLPQNAVGAFKKGSGLVETLNTASGGKLASSLGGAEGLATASNAAGAAGAFVVVAKELAEVPWKIKAFADSVSAANRQFVNASGSMAAVFAEADFRTLMRENRQGERLAGSASYAETGRQDLADALAPIEDFGQNIRNLISGGLSSVMASALKESGISDMLAQATRDINKAVGVRDGETAAPLAVWMQSVAKDAREEAFHRNQNRKKLPPGRADRR